MNWQYVLKKLNTFAYVCALFLLFSNCSPKEQNIDKALLHGTWRGTLTYKHISEVKTFAPMLEDSLTTLVDTMIVLPDVGIDIAKTEARFWNVQSLNSSIFSYERDNKKVQFHKQKDQNRTGKDTSYARELSVIRLDEHPYAVITKLDADSLVLRLAVFTDSENQYLLKLKRK